MFVFNTKLHTVLGKNMLVIIIMHIGREVLNYGVCAIAQSEVRCRIKMKESHQETL